MSGDATITVTNLGDHTERWQRFAELLDLDCEEI